MHDQIYIRELAGKGQNCYTIPAHPGNLVWWREGEGTALYGQRLVVSRGNVDLNLWRVDGRDKGRVKLIASTKEESDAQYSPDGERIVFRSDQSYSHYEV
jgi:hypothetical protein